MLWLPDGVDYRVEEELQQGEDAEHHPVAHPGGGRLRGPVEDRLEGHEGGVDHAHQRAGDEGVQVHGE